jgi:ribose transport system permease protein
MAQMMVNGIPMGVAIISGILIGAFIGIINASIITVFNLPPFLVTMAMMSILRGTCYLVTKQKPVTGVPRSFSWIGQGYLLKIPFPIYIMLIVIILIWIIANRTKLGRYLLAMGGNLEATRVSGINVVAVRYGVYAITGICGAIASVVMCARASSAQPTGGLNMEMEAIAAAVIGGTSMMGGNANIVGAFFGALIVGMVNNGLNLLGVDSSWQVVAKGALILIAVVLDSISTMILRKVNTSV